MATTTIPSQLVQDKARELVALGKRWPIIRDPQTGARRVAMENLEGTRVYYLEPSGRACSCTAGQHGTLCCHRLALIERLNQETLATWVDEMVKPRASYATLFPECKTDGCRDLSDTRDGLCDRCASERVGQR